MLSDLADLIVDVISDFAGWLIEKFLKRFTEQRHQISKKRNYIELGPKHNEEGEA